MLDLGERAFDLAFGRLGTEGPMLPFALFSGVDGGMQCLTIVTDRSDKAAYLGRRLVRENAASAEAYAIATDAYVRRDGERLDAVIVETATRGESAAQLVAQPYERNAAEPARRLGTPIDLGTRPSELVRWDPFALDWGAVTPDIYVEARKMAVHAVNHDLDSVENVGRTVRFLRARIRHHAPHLPAGSVQLVHFDDRGQTLTSDTRDALRALSEVAQIAFTTEMRK
jgi:hypothetical protein